jgi:uncharacterized protein YjbJ (UPF0337 family)
MIQMFRVHIVNLPRGEGMELSPRKNVFLKRMYKNRKANIMDKDRIEGSANQAKGKIKETLGKLTGDAKLQAEGNSEKIAGKVQNVVGGIKDTIKDAAKSNS